MFFSLFCVVFCTVEFIPHNSAVSLPNLVTSLLVKKRPNEIQSNLSMGGGLFHLRALLTFHTALHQKDSFMKWLLWHEVKFQESPWQLL